LSSLDNSAILCDPFKLNDAAQTISTLDTLLEFQIMKMKYEISTFKQDASSSVIK